MDERKGGRTVADMEWQRERFRTHIRAARQTGKPLVIHEQNAVPGLANRVLAGVADRVLSAFPDAFEGRVDVIWSGNPIRAEIVNLAPPEARFANRSGPLRLLIVGGSLGARGLNEIVPQALALLPAAERPIVVHQAGAAHADTVRQYYRLAGVDAEVLAFVEDMAARYGAADLIICRAGATTVTELAVAGVGSILVPFPHAVDDHQTRNARYLADRGAALLMPQPMLTPQLLADALRGMSRAKLLEMARAARGRAKLPCTTQWVQRLLYALFECQAATNAWHYTSCAGRCLWKTTWP
jgi:UDP-N-acetylglucosamine--N-acetylmuramyl-(pentapeptide) pyrophosphoryl-undecaprenol N-acetylglucosamine transferase